MVYRGKPSKGCGLCRKRKIKCDQEEPACGQCLRARKPCPGYRDLQALMFQDESEHVIRKVQKESTKKDSPGLTQCNDEAPIELVNGSSSASQPFYWPSQDDKAFSTALTYPAAVGDPGLSLGQNMEDTATAYFFQNFVKLAFGSQRGYMDYMPQVFGSGPARGALSATVISVGMAGLSNVTSNPGMLVQARKSYDQALTLTRKAILDPEVAKTDDMVAAVLLLSLFETVTCSTPEAMELWTDHMKGALALLALRGPQQLQSPIGRQIFFIARAQIIISCIQRNLFVPEEINQLTALADTLPVSPEGRVPNALIKTTTRFCNLRAFLKHNPPTDLAAVITSLVEIDSDMVAAQDSMGQEWTFEVHTLPGKPHETLSGSYFVYKSFWHASIHLNLRSTRLLINEFLLDKIEQAAETADEQSRQMYEEMALVCRQTLLRMADEICASVPYGLGLEGTGAGSAESGPLPAYGGYTLMWPLFLSAINPTAEPPLQNWIVQRLEYIAKNMGIAQAHALSVLVKRQMAKVAAARRFL